MKRGDLALEAISSIFGFIIIADIWTVKVIPLNDFLQFLFGAGFVGLAVWGRLHEMDGHLDKIFGTKKEKPKKHAHSEHAHERNFPKRGFKEREIGV